MEFVNLLAVNGLSTKVLVGWQLYRTLFPKITIQYG
jgi:hypothetical protein